MNKQKTLIIVFAIIIVAGGGWYYFKTRRATAPVVQEATPFISPTSSANVTLPTSTPRVTAPVVSPPSKNTIPKPVVMPSGIKGIAKIGPTCPVMPAYDPTGKCADKPFAGKFEIKSSIGTVVKTFSTGATGTFSIALPAGTYSIEPMTGTYYPHMNTLSGIIVKSNQLTNVTIQFDSGIR